LNGLMRASAPKESGRKSCVNHRPLNETRDADSPSRKTGLKNEVSAGGVLIAIVLMLLTVSVTASAQTVPSNNSTATSFVTSSTVSSNSTTSMATSTVTTSTASVPPFSTYMASLPTQIKNNPLFGLGIISAFILLSIPFLGRTNRNTGVVRGGGSRKSTVRTSSRTTRTTAPPPPTTPPPRSPPPPPPIIPASVSPDPWGVLDVPRNTSRAVIKTKYHSLLIDLHPDKLPFGATPAQRRVIEDKVKEINNAYNSLKQLGYA
jgi:hypothetical protein